MNPSNLQNPRARKSEELGMLRQNNKLVYKSIQTNLLIIWNLE
jgi:hypothetical protein